MNIIDVHSLEDMAVLSPGVLLNINGDSKIVLQDYTSEIESFVQNWDSTKPNFPFVNQKDKFMEALRAFTTQYAFVLLKGDFGTGKSLMIHYMLDVVSGKISLDEVRQYAPETIELFENIISKVRENENMNFLMLPDFTSPLAIEGIPYTSDAIGRSDNSIMKDFYRETFLLLNEYASMPLKKIKREFTKEEFQEYCNFEAYTLLLNFYHDLAKTKSTMETSTSLSIIDLNPSLETITGNWGFYRNQNAHYASDPFLAYITDSPKGKKIPFKSLKGLLDEKGIRKFFATAYNNVLDRIGNVEIEGISENEKNKIYLDAFTDSIRDINKVLLEAHEQERINDDVDAYKEILSRRGQIIHRTKISHLTVEEIIENLQKIRTKYLGRTETKKINELISSTIDYFTTNYQILERALENLVPPPEEMVTVLDHEAKKVLHLPKFTEMRLPFGTNYHDISQLFNPNYLRNLLFVSGSGHWSTMTSTYIRGNFFEVEFKFPKKDDSMPIPPHSLINQLGPFFAMGIWAFPDKFEDFIEKLSESSDENKFTMEQFLEYLQTGVLRVVYDGIGYQFSLPKMMIAATAEDDPFLIMKGIMPVIQGGAKDRIITVHMNEMLPNRSDVREGTYQVIYNSIRKYNKINAKYNLEITPDSVDMLLKRTLHPWDTLSMNYRKLDQTVQSICAYAVSVKKDNITPDIVKNWWASLISPNFFLSIDQGIKKGAYIPSIVKQTGAVNGLAVMYNHAGSSLPIKSELLSDLQKAPNDPVFVLRDDQSKMIAEDTQKGYLLATDFIRKLLDFYLGSKQSTNWQLVTHFSENWAGVGGPSASTAMAISILSCLSGEEVYNNRFYTGTLDPSGSLGNISEETAGRVGIIGGTYYKGLVANRIKQVTKSEKPVYFLFPKTNLSDFTQDMTFDTFDLDERVTCIPVENFYQAYFFATCTEGITADQIKNCNEYAQRAMEKTMKKVQKNLKRFDKPYILQLLSR
jgi:hypothetical protein